MHPRVAGRNCSHCRRYSYNEETGEPVVSNRTGKPKRRQKPPPCETKQGCPKGHWSRPIQLSANDYKLLSLYSSSKASGGAILSEAEKQDDLIQIEFGLLEQTFEALDNAESAERFHRQYMATIAAKVGK